MLLTEHHFEFPSLKGDCTGSSESERFCMWCFLVLLSLSYKVFWVRCDTNCIVSWHVRSSLLFILTRVPTHKKYRILCYHLRSNSDWLPIRCAYFILALYTVHYQINQIRHIISKQKTKTKALWYKAYPRVPEIIAESECSHRLFGIVGFTS